jgi:hypothetical protein
MQVADPGGSGFFLAVYDGVLVTTSYVMPDNLSETLVKDRTSISICLSNQVCRILNLSDEMKYRA